LVVVLDGAIEHLLVMLARAPAPPTNDSDEDPRRPRASSSSNDRTWYNSLRARCPHIRHRMAADSLGRPGEICDTEVGVQPQHLVEVSDGALVVPQLRRGDTWQARHQAVPQGSA
jgi:hypothetical protein